MTKDAVVVVIASWEHLLLRTLLLFVGARNCLLPPPPSLAPPWLFFVFIYSKGEIYIYIYFFAGCRLFRAGCEERRLVGKGVANRSGVERAGSRRVGGHRRAVACVDDRPPKWCCFCAVSAKREIAKRPMFITQTPPRTMPEKGTLHDG